MGNGLLQIGIILCSVRTTSLLTGGDNDRIYSNWKLPGVSELGGCGRSHGRTMLRPAFPVKQGNNREIPVLGSNVPNPLLLPSGVRG